MQTQRDDLVKSEEKLNRVIYEITQVMKRQFVEQFALINRNFNIVFRELFEGGHAEVQLSDEENVLESNIDIIVQPPGKKLQNMLLLSGGEKAMVAIALIFGILRMRPARFTSWTRSKHPWMMPMSTNLPIISGNTPTRLNSL